MFQGTLLDSSPIAGRRSRWPMATAFTLQMMLASAVVIVPLLSTGIIPFSSHLPLFAPTTYTPIANPPAPSHAASPGAPHLPIRAAVVSVFSPHSIINPFQTQGANTDDPQTKNFPILNVCDKCPPPSGIIPNARVIQPPPVPPPPARVRVSQLSEGMLLHKVVPVYPRIAIPTGVQGDVKLHAFISKDGSIESLRVISGPPLLTGAALEAVSQWKYRPYVLNGDPVEVETYITVTFTRGH